MENINFKKEGLPDGTKIVVKGEKSLLHKRTLTEVEKKLLEDLVKE
jgi:hypothetical protein